MDITAIGTDRSAARKAALEYADFLITDWLKEFHASFSERLTEERIPARETCFKAMAELERQIAGVRLVATALDPFIPDEADRVWRAMSCLDYFHSVIEREMPEDAE